MARGAKNRYGSSIPTLLRQGLTIAEISQRTGAAETTVSRYRKALGMQRKEAEQKNIKLPPGFHREWMQEVNRVRALGGLEPLSLPAICKEGEKDHEKKTGEKPCERA